MERKKGFVENIYLKVAQEDNDSSDNLVGIRITKNEGKEKMTVIFPIGYDIGNQNTDIKYKEEYNKDIKALIQCLSIKLNNDENNEKIKFSFVSAIQLMRDYQKIGLYKENATEENKEFLGKLDWKKTINNSSNKIFWRNSKILPEIFYKKINYNYQGKIQQIQKYCLGFVAMVIGPFYNFNYPRFQKPFSDSEMVKIIEEELLKTNIDDKKKILSHLKNFITESNCINVNINNMQVIEFGTKKFHNIWEKLVDKKFGGISDLRKYNPKAIYLDKELNKMHDAEHKVNPSRPDTIIDDKDGKKLIILDAKYYKIGNLPREYDINKQLRYAEYCKNQKEKNDKEKRIVYNIFILPNLIKENKQYDIDSFATNENFYDSFIEDDEIIDGKKIIAVCYIDTKTFILESDNYWKRKLDDILKQINETYIKVEKYNK